jgi:hypothetical protein
LAVPLASVALDTGGIARIACGSIALEADGGSRHVSPLFQW